MCPCIWELGKVWERDCKTWLHGSYATLSNCLRGAGRSIATHKDRVNARIPGARGPISSPDSYETKSLQRAIESRLSSCIPQRSLMNNEPSFLNLGFRRQLLKRKTHSSCSPFNVIRHANTERNGRRRIRHVTQSIFIFSPPPSRNASSVTNAVNLHASVRLLFGEIASQSQIRDADVPVLVE